MTKLDRFEDLIAWQKARLLTREIYGVAKQNAFAEDYGLAQANEFARIIGGLRTSVARQR